MITRTCALPFVLSWVLAGAVIGGCNTRTPVFDSDMTTTAPSTITSPVTTPSNIARIDLTPAGLNGGSSGRGTVMLDLPVPPAGATVSLRASDPGVSVSPPVITLPAGSIRADFSFSTQATATDKVVDIIVATDTQSKAAPLVVWTTSAPMFFSYSSDRGESVGGGRTDRYTPPAIFVAKCEGNLIFGSVSRSTGAVFSFTFRAPVGTPLRPGTYENASGTTSSSSFIAISGFGSCPIGAIGRFTVHDVDFAARAGGKVDRFWVSFEQTCQGDVETLRGELRLLNPTLTAQGSGTCLGGR